MPLIGEAALKALAIGCPNLRTFRAFAVSQVGLPVCWAATLRMTEHSVWLAVETRSFRSLRATVGLVCIGWLSALIAAKCWYYSNTLKLVCFQAVFSGSLRDFVVPLKRDSISFFSFLPLVSCPFFLVYEFLTFLFDDIIIGIITITFIILL